MTELAEVSSIAKEALKVALKADNKIDSHEDICALRYAGILKAIAESIESNEKAQKRNEREINVLSTRMWLFAGSIIGVLFTIIYFLLNKVL